MTPAVELTGSKLDRVRALNDLREAIAHSRDSRSLFSTVCSIAGRILHHDEARLVLFTPGVNDVQVFVPPGSNSVTARLSGPESGLGDDSTEPGVFTVRSTSGEIGSGVRAPIRLDDESVGGIFRLLSHRPHDYTQDDVIFVQLLADQIAGALARQRLSSMSREAALERERAANLETSEQLLQALANVLDIRLVFPQISEITRKILPHDRLTMTFLDAQGACVMQAASNLVGPNAVRATGVDTTHLTDGFFRIVDDLATHVKPGVTYDPPDHQDLRPQPNMRRCAV